MTTATSKSPNVRFKAPESNASKGFLDLPPELRVQIYDYFFPRAKHTMYLRQLTDREW